MTMAAPRHRTDVETGSDVVTIHLDDALLADGLADVRWLLHDALMAGARRLVVDLSGLQHLSSPAVASFLWAHRTCRARGGAVVLRGANRRTEDLLRRTGLRRVIEVEPAHAGAVA
ncbi:STAS domain-containing protein [Geodermatophilus sabuli]|uniref:Anti-anti-sigma factor n=1 Tax=Geodermatophilus sabuli TaxID=1564158 RepID=A0A285EL35_9ACTN|nr:STAS domain-containing protein [Geodermatophilus sabuli]MBB3086850.1 anti-anti-sigma factor [Geodermatophilus sabuli]SNX98776.1 anti-anti-sigma factor [Geodermatophilus sabuli]